MGEGANSRYCFAKGKDQIVVPEQDPWKTYARIFGGAGAQPAMPDPAVARLLSQKKSILDYVGRDLDDFAARVGKEDGEIVRGHLHAIRDLEKELQDPEAGRLGVRREASMPADPTMGINYPAKFKMSLDLMVAAFKCGVTRVAAIQMVDAGGANLPWNFRPRHPREGRAATRAPAATGTTWATTRCMGGTDHKRIVDKWCMSQMAELLVRMKAIPEEGGTMLSQQRGAVDQPHGGRRRTTTARSCPGSWRVRPAVTSRPVSARSAPASPSAACCATWPTPSACP